MLGNPASAERALDGDVDQPVVPASPPRSRWRFLVLPLVPLVALWDAGRAMVRAWGEFGMRMLEKLDPLFARFTGLAVRIGERLRPLLERVAARADRILARVRPTLDRITRAVQTVIGWIERIVGSVTGRLEPVRVAMREAGRLLGAPFRIIGHYIGCGAAAVRRWGARLWGAARTWTRNALGR